MQTPAEGILVRKDLGDFKAYLVACDCGSADHNHEVHVEATDNSVNVTVYVQVSTKRSFKDRCAALWSLLTKGYVETEVELVLSEQQAKTYAATLSQAVADVENYHHKTKTPQ